MSDAQYEAFRKSVNRAVIELRQEEELAKLERHAVVSEQSVYGPHSEHSWFRDLAASANPEAPIFGRRSEDMAPAAVEARLAKHAIDMRSAVRRGSE